jgi:hypothetical protein
VLLLLAAMGNKWWLLGLTMVSIPPKLPTLEVGQE